MHSLCCQTSSGQESAGAVGGGQGPADGEAEPAQSLEALQVSPPAADSVLYEHAQNPQVGMLSHERVRTIRGCHPIRVWTEGFVTAIAIRLLGIILTAASDRQTSLKYATHRLQYRFLLHSGWLCSRPGSGQVMAQAQREAEEQEAERQRREVEVASAADLLQLRALEEQAAMANIARLRQGEQPQARPSSTH